MVETNIARATLGRQIRHGVSWNAANLLVNKGMSILVRLLLAHLLMPEAFGLIAMIVILLGLVQIFVDFGLANALIQRKRDENSLIRYDSAFWFMLGSGFGWMALFIFAGIPLMIWLYNEPQLHDLALAMSLSILLCSLSILPSVRLTRRMHFKSQVIAEVVSTVVASIIAVAMAIAGAGVWALVAQKLSFDGLKTAMLWRAVPWRPRWRYSWDSLRDVMAFSGWMLGNQIIYYMRKNLDKLLIGAILGANMLGVYTLAYMLTETMRARIGSVIGKVMFPVYSRNQCDLTEVRRFYLGVIRYTTLSIFPLATLMILFADQIVSILFGEAWVEAVAPLQILSVASMVFVVSGDPSAVLRGIGKSNVAFNISFWNTVVVAIPSLAIGTVFFGLPGAAWAILTYSLSSRFISQFFLRREIAVTLWEILQAAAPAVFISTSLVIVIYSWLYL